jgi:hypothetical protein
MKRFITYLICCLFLFSLSGNLAAVEKKEKKSVKKQVVQKKKPIPKKGALKLRKSRKLPARKKYDTFIDRNKNGIDDRRESLKVKPPAKTKKKTEKKKK